MTYRRQSPLLRRILFLLQDCHWKSQADPADLMIDATVADERTLDRLEILRPDSPDQTMGPANGLVKLITEIAGLTGDVIQLLRYIFVIVAGEYCISHECFPISIIIALLTLVSISIDHKLFEKPYFSQLLFRDF